MANLLAISEAVKLGAVVGLDRAAALVEAAAKQKAPVRSIFGGGKQRVRFKTMAEVKADRSIRRTLGLGREYVAAPRTRLRSRRGMGKAKTMTLDTANGMSGLRRYLGRRAGGLSPEAMSMLHRRGRYEVVNRLGPGNKPRAWYRGHIGGRLQGEITAVDAKQDGSRFRALVISPTPYAKYQEFGTAHNAAQPYLRPALHESASEVKAVIRSAIKGALRGERLQEEVEL